ncbi:MAG: RdgB/HAM1 family non-canonical purine NTP pyrophosphatase [Planctomycetota bacterium]
MRLLIATSNPHKVDEIGAILGQGVELLTLADVGLADMPEPVEDADTFEGNAVIKAKAYAAAAEMACLADDSGLVVDALDGAPGVYSARYAGVGNTRAERDTANNRKLIEALGETPAAERSARFVCVVAYAVPGGEVVTARGTFEGRIITADQASDPAQPWQGRGGNGFGYDPLFWLDDVAMTSAELTPDAKHARSHRGAAVRALMETEALR